MIKNAAVPSDTNESKTIHLVGSPIEGGKYTAGAREAENRIGGAVAYVNSLMKDLHAAGYTVVVTESREYLPSIGIPSSRARPSISVRLYEPGEKVESRDESLDH